MSQLLAAKNQGNTSHTHNICLLMIVAKALHFCRIFGPIQAKLFA